MTSPPLPSAEPLATTAEYSGADNTEDAAAYDPFAVISELFPQSYADRTGRAVLAKLQRQVGWFEPNAEVSLKIKSPSRGDVLIHLDDAVAVLAAALLGSCAEIVPTRSGRAHRARIKRTTPVAESLATKATRAHTQTPLSERGI